MTRDDREIESVVRRALADEVGLSRYELWFGEGVQLQVLAETVRVTAAERFVVEQLRRLFRDTLHTVARRHVGPECAVEFQVGPACAPAGSSCAADPAPRVNGDPKLALHGASPPACTAAMPGRRSARLEDFVVGDSSRVAVAAARRVTERPGIVSPLFLYGPPGCGKTHLLEGIAGAARRVPTIQRILYLSAEQFTTAFLEALHGRGLPSFRLKCRRVDFLVLDDLQFFTGKRATLAELQHTVDSLLREQRQLVLAADRPPAELKLGHELTARMLGGLVCGLEPPDATTRRTILERLATNCETPLPMDVLQWLADQLPGDARQLQGALHQLEIHAAAHEQPITLELARDVLSETLAASQRVVQLADIDHAVCDVLGLEPSSLQSAGKSKPLNDARMLAMWLARQYTRAAYAEIGQFFGRRSHSTVISAHTRVSDWVVHGRPVRVSHGELDIREVLRRVESRLRCG